MTKDCGSILCPPSSVLCPFSKQPTIGHGAILSHSGLFPQAEIRKSPMIAIRHCFLIYPFRNPYSYTFGSMCFARFFIAARRFARSAVYVASGLSDFIFTLPFASVVVPWK